MKKISIILFIFTSTALSTSLAACSVQQPQVTATSEVTVTSLPPTATIIPTSTLHPQFIEVQEQIAASGERFTLLSDGTIQDGAKTVPGLSVDKNGAITLQGDSSQVIINPEDVSFDDTKGVNVNGYTLDEATGKWGAMGTSLSIENLDAKRWGDYSLIENPDGYYEMKDVQGNLIPEVKLFRDGTAELTYSSKELAVAFQAISVGAEGQLSFGLWNYENGEWSVADTPSIVEIANATEKIDSQGLVIRLGSENLEEMWQTAFAARNMKLFETPGYDPNSEFTGIPMKVGTEVVENFDKPPSGWEFMNTTLAKVGSVTISPVPPMGYDKLLYTADMNKNMKGQPFLVALEAGVVPITFINADGSVQEVAYLVPLIIRDTDSKLKGASTLLREVHIKEIVRGLNKENRNLLIPYWIYTLSMEDDKTTATDTELTQIMASRNQPIIGEMGGSLDGKKIMSSFPEQLQRALFILRFYASDFQ